MADQLSPSNRSKDAAQKAAKGRISNARSLNRDPMEWAHEIHQGNRTALSQAITLTESANPPDQLMLDHLLQAIAHLAPKRNRSALESQAFRVWVKARSSSLRAAIDRPRTSSCSACCRSQQRHQQREPLGR